MASKIRDKLRVINIELKTAKIHLSLKKNINEVTLDKYQDKMFTR